MRSVSGIGRGYRDGGGSNAAVVVRSGDAIHLLGGLRLPSRCPRRRVLCANTDVGALGRVRPDRELRGWLAELASPSEPEDVEVILDAHVLQKAFFELRGELDNCAETISIPLSWIVERAEL